MDHAAPLPFFEDMLKEEYLWSEDYNEDDDLLRYEDENVYPDDLFYSFYYYSYRVIENSLPILKAIEHKSAKELCNLLSNK